MAGDVAQLAVVKDVSHVLFKVTGDTLKKHRALIFSAKDDETFSRFHVDPESDLQLCLLVTRCDDPVRLHTLSPQVAVKERASSI